MATIDIILLKSIKMWHFSVLNYLDIYFKINMYVEKENKNE